MAEVGNARACVLFLTDVVNDRIFSHFLRLKSEAPRSCDVIFVAPRKLASRLPRALNPLLLDYETALRAFPGRKPWDRCTDDRPFLPGYIDCLWLTAMNECAGPYRYFWPVEYDTDFSGHWSVVFDHFDQTSSADLLGSHLFSSAENPGWGWWSSFVPPREFDAHHKFAAFLVLARYSEALRRLLNVQYQKESWVGHFEAVLPTIAIEHGLEIEDFGGENRFVKEQNRNRFYRPTQILNHTATSVAGRHPETLRRYFLDAPELFSARDTLWHPVKVS